MEKIYDKKNLFGERLQLDLFGNVEVDKIIVEEKEDMEYQNIPHNLFDSQTYFIF